MGNLHAKDGSDWREILEPYVNIDGSWKTVHAIHIKDGSDWRVIHRTAFSRYNQDSDNVITTTGDGSYTVPNNGTRYLKVQLEGQGGGAGGGIKTSGAGGTGSHFNCSPGFSAPMYTVSATGGQGGDGGKIVVILRVAPGDSFSWKITDAGSGGDKGDPMELIQSTYESTPYSASSTKYGSDGTDGGDTVFTGSNSTSIIAYGGVKGGGGFVRVDATCENSAGQSRGWSASQHTGSTGAGGGTSASSSNLISTESTGTVGSTGGSGNENANGDDGTGGRVIITPYKPNLY